MTSDALTNTTLPSTEATITVRVIKSFEYRTTRNLVLHKLNLQTTTVGELKDLARKGSLDIPSRTCLTSPLPSDSIRWRVEALPKCCPRYVPWIASQSGVLTSGNYRHPQTVYQGPRREGRCAGLALGHAASQAASIQTSNLIINLDHEDWILGGDDGILADVGFG